MLSFWIEVLGLIAKAELTGCLCADMVVLADARMRLHSRSSSAKGSVLVTWLLWLFGVGSLPGQVWAAPSGFLSAVQDIDSLLAFVPEALSGLAGARDLSRTPADGSDTTPLSSDSSWLSLPLSRTLVPDPSPGRWLAINILAPRYPTMNLGLRCSLVQSWAGVHAAVARVSQDKWPGLAALSRTCPVSCLSVVA